MTTVMSTAAANLADAVRDALDFVHARLGVISEPSLRRAFKRTRADLRAVGLLADGKYLDRVRCYRALLPSMGEVGYVYDSGVPWQRKLVGFEPGTIYIPLNAPVSKTPNHSLTDVVRHEMGHAWRFLDPGFFRRPWFEETFGARYEESWGVGETPAFDAREFVTDYARTRAAEDFCETFMVLLRCWGSLERFDRRPGVKRKLLAVAKAVSVASREHVAVTSTELAAPRRPRRPPPPDRVTPLTLSCPINDREIEILPNDGAYVCPHCEAAIEVVGGRPQHAEMLRYVCPQTSKAEFVAWEAGEFHCLGCRRDVLVRETGRKLVALHQILVVSGARARQRGGVVCPVNDQDVEVGEDDGTYKCPLCKEPIEVTGGRAAHQAMLGFECPQTGERVHVAAEAAESFVCLECTGDVLVYEDGEYLKVAHMLDLAD